MSWYHGGISDLHPGELILPAEVPGVRSTTLEHRAKAIEKDFGQEIPAERSFVGVYRPDRVYVTSDLDTARLYATGGGSVYEVDPVGALEEDPERDPLSGPAFMCEAARILRVVEDDVPLLVADLLRLAVRRGTVSGYYFRFAEEFFWSLLRRLPQLRGVHGFDHWRQVFRNGLLIARLTRGVDPFVVVAFAALHDVCRHSDGHDPEHGVRAAELARGLVAAGVLCLLEPQLELLYEALAEHDRGQVATDPTIGACWDADRLDLPRVGVEVDPRFLSTSVGVALSLLPRSVSSSEPTTESEHPVSLRIDTAVRVRRPVRGQSP
jgi:uncharacterized protein